MATHNIIPDARVEKEALTLQMAGFKVFIVTPGVKGNVVENAFSKIFTYEHTYKHNYFIRSAVNQAVKFYEKIVIENGIKIIHAHNIFAAYIAMNVAKKYNLKFIYDDHETWTLWLKERAKKAIGIKNKLIRHYVYFKAKNIERKIASRADLIIVTNIMCKPFFEKIGINESKIISIENIPLESEINKALASSDLVLDFFKNDKRKKVIHVYHKSKGRSAKQSQQDEIIDRKFDVYVNAIEQLDNWVLVLFGERNPELEQRGVVFIDFMPRINYLANVAKADVGINPLVITDKTVISSQNRVYEFAKLGLKIISTKTPLLEKNFDNMLIWMNPDESVEKLVDILRNIEKYPTKKAIQKFSKKFSWEKETEKMIIAYKKIINKN